MASDTGLANAAWEALFRAQMTIAAELHAGDAWGDLVPSDYGVLYALSTARTGLRMSELGRDILLSQAGLSRAVSRLEARGLIERQPDPEDARASILSLSKAGVHMQKRVGAKHGRHVAEAMTRRLGDAELTQLRDLCERLLAAAPPTSEV
ncbi:MarR family winged helix-turn-helix transcriptional regulator [Devosia sp. A16]|uniref:MarR family winged helix-turn-helix transcriptional regulator n=1 Tax=Devosia sp. A16 TaxID=1736675 RepID=UPI0006D8605B|nr:MarR family transcriptional regulator [Devosia sp. A16]